MFILAPTCTDNVKNQDESDKDCGGKFCPKCADTKRCNKVSDCKSAVCRSNICQGRILSSHDEISLVLL